MALTYTVVLEREEDGRYSVSVPALPGCHTWGETLPQALLMVEEAIEGYLEVLEEDGDPLPADKPEVRVGHCRGECSASARNIRPRRMQTVAVR